MSDFGMQVLQASLSPMPAGCRILTFDNVADAVTFSQTINLEMTNNFRPVFAFSRRDVGGRDFWNLGTLAFKRDQRDVWLKNPMCGMYTVKIDGESKGEYLTPEEVNEETEMAWLEIRQDEILAALNYRPPTPSSSESSSSSDELSSDEELVEQRPQKRRRSSSTSSSSDSSSSSSMTDEVVVERRRRRKRCRYCSSSSSSSSFDSSSTTDMED